jgi:pimeloyl-ACP methyl ester carboxylesterase
MARPEAGGKVAFVGHSAGGLVSLLAAAEAGADAYVGLDAVDASGLGEAADGAVTAPALFLNGDPSLCNASGNNSAWTTGGDAWRVAVTDAGHCDFESDTDWICTAGCGSEDTGRQALIETYTVAWLVHHLLGGADAWVEGSEAEADRRAGRIDW